MHDSSLKQTSTAPPAESAEDRARAVAELFEEHNRALVSFLSLRLNSPQEAREVAQEAYVRLLELDRTGAVSFMRAYLFKIAANLAVDRIRRQIVRREFVERNQPLIDEIDEAAAPERQLMARQEFAEIERRLAGLPPKCSRAFVMYAVLERPMKEIAEEMNVTERMVRNYIVRGYAVCRIVRGEGA